MSEETPEHRDEVEAAEETSVSEADATDASETDATPASPSAAPDEVEPEAGDEEAEEAASDVLLEADDEAEGEPEDVEDDDVEAEAAVEEKPRRPRRRRGAAEAEKAEEKKPAAAPRRGRRERPTGPPPVVRAQARYVRSSARKARLVCDNIRGKSVVEARAILAHTPRAIARDWSKLLESAVANAEHNHSLDGEDLYVKAVHADEGPTIKRFRPRAMGRATKIRKRTAHLTILLTPKE